MRHRNIRVLIVVLTMLLPFFTFLNQRAAAAGQTYLNVVNPLTGDKWFNFTTHNRNVGNTFIINITIVDVIDMIYWQFALQWNVSLLTYVNTTIPTDNVFAGKNIVTASDTSTPGLLIYAAALLDPRQAFTGSGVLAQVELRIVNGVGQSSLSFEGIATDTFLLDGNGNDISFTAINGYYEYKWTGQTYLRVINPLTSNEWFNFTTLNKSVGDTFIINITIDDVVNLNTWQFWLQWDPSLLTYVNATIPTDNVFAGKSIITARDTSNPGLLGYAAAPQNTAETFTGSGRLAQVELRIVNGVGQSSLSFEGLGPDTFLLDGNGNDISFTAINGYYKYSVGAPQIENVSLTPTCPYPYVPSNTTRTNEPILITANVSEPLGGGDIVTVLLSYRANAEDWWNTTMTYNATSGLWTRIIPGQQGNSTIELFVSACDAVGNWATSSVMSFRVKPLPRGDVNGDGVTNMRDIQFCILHWNERTLELAMLNFNKHE